MQMNLVICVNLRIRRKGNMDQATVRLQRDNVMLDFEEGRLPEAEARLSELIREVGVPATVLMKHELCRCLLDRATVRRFANRWQQALDDLTECERLGRTLSALGRNAILRNVYLVRAQIVNTPLATVYNPEAASQSLDEFRTLGATDWTADQLASDLAFRKKEWEQSAQLAMRVAQTLSAEGWQRGAMSSRLRAGRAYLELNDLRRAEDEITAAQQFFEQYGPPDQLAAAQMARARLQVARGNNDSAWALANRALQGIEGLIRHFRSLFDQQLFVLDKLDYYFQAFAIGWAKGGRQGLLRAWTISERAKSFYLCQLVANADVPLFDGIAADQIAQLRDLEARLDDCEANHGRLKALGAKPEYQAESEKQYRELSETRQRLMEALMRANPRWAGLRTPPPFDLEAELARLDPAWVPISYFFQPQPEGAVLHIFYAGSDREPHCLQTSWSRDDLAQIDQARAEMRRSEKERLFLPIFPEGLVQRVLPPALCAALQWRVGATRDVPFGSRRCGRASCPKNHRNDSGEGHQRGEGYRTRRDDKR